jgi:hypothetical protein
MLLWKSRETKHVGEKPRKQNTLGVKPRELNMLGKKPRKLNTLVDISWETKYVAGETPGNSTCVIRNPGET